MIDRSWIGIPPLLVHAESEGNGAARMADFLKVARHDRPCRFRARTARLNEQNNTSQGSLAVEFIEFVLVP